MKLRLSIGLVLLFLAVAVWQARKLTDPKSRLAVHQTEPVQLAPRVAPLPDRTNADKGIYGKFLAKMTEDPQTEQFIRDQQRSRVELLYSPLVKRLALSPEIAEEFMNLLAENALRRPEQASAPSGERQVPNPLDPPGASAQNGIDEQIKELLGGARFNQYKEFQDTAIDRIQLNLLREQMGDRALTEQQTEQLLVVLKQERQSLSAAGRALPNTSPDLALASGALSEEQTETLLQGQESVNHRVYERAKAILAPEQLDALARFQTNRLQTLRASMTMARRLFTPANPAIAP